MIRLSRSALLVTLVASAAFAAPAPQELPTNIAAAATDPARATDAAEDARRHGPEILAFAGVKRGDTVIDLVPGAGYWTKLFSKAVGPAGHVYGVWPQPMADHHAEGVVKYQQLIASPAFANVSASTQPATSLSEPKKADLVFTSQNYHDYPDKFMGPTDPAALNKAVFDALKPGGIFVIVDHAAQAGSGLRDTDTLHRIDPAIVKKQVTAAGFRFVGASRLLANPADDHTKEPVASSVRHPPWLGIAAAALIAGILLLAAVGMEIDRLHGFGIDQRIIGALREPGRPHVAIGPDWLPRLAIAITFLGSGNLLIPLVGVVLMLLAIRRRWLTAALTLAATLGGSQAVQLVKHLVDRPRPPIDGRLVEAAGMSFPSGHAADSAIVYLTLAALLAQIIPGHGRRVALFVFVTALVVAIGCTRVYLGVHWPSDVLAGWSFGALWALAWWSLGAWLRLRQAGRSALTGERE